MASTFMQNLNVNVVDRGQLAQQLSATAGFSTHMYVTEGPYRVLACDGTALYGSMDGSGFRKMADVPAKDVAWTNGAYVAVGDSGASASYDGFEWRQTSTSAFDMIVGGDGCFAAAKEGFSACYTADGASWTPFDSLLSSSNMDMAYSCGQVVLAHFTNGSTYNSINHIAYNISEKSGIPVINATGNVLGAQIEWCPRFLTPGRMQTQGSYFEYSDVQEVDICVNDWSAPGPKTIVGYAIISAQVGGNFTKLTDISGSAYLPGVGYCALGSSNRGFDSCVYDEQTSSVSFAQVPMSQNFPFVVDDFEGAFWSAPRGKMIVRTKQDVFLESSDGLSWTQVADDRPFAQGASVRYRTMDYGVPQSGTLGLPRAALARASALPKSTYWHVTRPDRSRFEAPVYEKVTWSYGDVDDNNLGVTDDFHIAEFDGWAYASLAIGSVTNNHIVYLVVYPKPDVSGSGSYGTEYNGSYSSQRHAYLWLPVRKGYGVRLVYSSAQSMTVSQYALWPNRPGCGVGFQS